MAVETYRLLGLDPEMKGDLPPDLVLSIMSDIANGDSFHIRDIAEDIMLAVMLDEEHMEENLAKISKKYQGDPEGLKKGAAALSELFRRHHMYGPITIDEKGGLHLEKE